MRTLFGISSRSPFELICWSKIGCNADIIKLLHNIISLPSVHSCRSIQNPSWFYHWRNYRVFYNNVKWSTQARMTCTSYCLAYAHIYFTVHTTSRSYESFRVMNFKRAQPPITIIKKESFQKEGAVEPSSCYGRLEPHPWRKSNASP